MKIAHVSMYDTAGGAARAGYRLHAGLRGLGHESTFYVRHRFGSDADVRLLAQVPNFVERLRNRWRRKAIPGALARYAATRPAGLENFSSDQSPWPAETLGLPACDVINLHWVAELLDYAAFFTAMPERAPIVWTLHDMAAFTGGCHYDGGCGRFAKECGACPQLGSRGEQDLSRTIWRRKREALAKIPEARLRIVAPSRWLAAAAGKSSLLGGFPISVIPYGVNLEDFAPRDKQASRGILDLPVDKAVVLFVAASATNQRKGFRVMAEALARLGARKDIVLCSLGSGRPEIAGDIPHVHLGQVDNDRMLSMVYSAADIFILPSLEDNLPCTALESMACGTPIIASDVGGIPDAVRPGETGLLVKPSDPVELLQAIELMLRDSVMRRRLAARCREIALQEYGMATQAGRYVKLYEEMVGAKVHDVPAGAPAQTF